MTELEIQKELVQTAPNTSPTSLIISSVLISLLVGLGIGYLAYPMVNKPQQDLAVTPTPVVETSPRSTDTPLPTAVDKDEPFCDQYGTFDVRKEDLLEQYTVIPGDTLRDIAKKKLGDEKKASLLIGANPELASYEIDDTLPLNTKLFLPNEKFSEEGITAYIKARGNIGFNQEKPMFGVSAPNSGTGPFIISKKIEPDLKNIKDGDCVEVIYGSRGFDPQKVVFEVKAQ